MILIISHDKDGHSIVVQEELTRVGYPFTLLDLSLFPKQAQLSMEYESDHYSDSVLQYAETQVRFKDCGSVWWRRPQPFTLHDELNGGVGRNFSYNECMSAINGLWLLSDAAWINNPVNDETASRKAYQLKMATACGLTIPRTLITNDPKKAVEFIHTQGQGNVIYKSFSATEQAWRETRLVKQEELENIESVKYAPVIFQECIHADIDLRVTIIGDNIFPAAIHSKDTSYKYDFRMNYHECKIVQHPLPDKLNKQLLRFMKEMGITYGAVDLRLRPTGEYVFLEVNTAGQWLFMEQPTGMPITQTLVRTLIENDLAYQDQKELKRKDKTVLA
jgi:glutathione synthase/RimK-type ligase-like ATP-grasp enzyme